ncbi:hypothetical protein PR202_ga19442 [Eleusine coracana subsp. coracana]|uniref:MSP domain-containing protein n=1 Tax=Eleusine coracana subsp. coracana TaxID=191504 RepID=A0AAV5CV47_ELECO|nr:hypothetical protein PR202_ga19442 [Eleusine coracana subsp. coracana]
MSNTLLRVYPSELKIPFEVKKQRSCCMQLTNRTDQCVAFKDSVVTMQAPMEMPPDYHCKDKFLVQSVEVPDGATLKELVPQLFTKAPGRVIEEVKLRVVYIAANPPSPVPEEAEEDDSSPRSEVGDNEVNRPSVCDVAPTETGVSREEPSCVEVLAVISDFAILTKIYLSSLGTSVISRFVGEPEYAVDENQMLQEQMEMFRETRSSQQGFSLVFVLLVFMSSVFVGHLMNGVKV